MTQFFDIPIIVFALLLFLVFQGLKQKTEDEDNITEENHTILPSFATLFFISTVTIIPYWHYQLALTNIEVFNSGKSLICNTSNYNFGNEEFLLDNKQWSLKGYEFVRNENGLIIKAHMCEER